jgi:hypothetical protein
MVCMLLCSARWLLRLLLMLLRRRHLLLQPPYMFLPQERKYTAEPIMHPMHAPHRTC